MIKFNKPINLNGTELRQELRNVGIVISDDNLAVRDISGDLYLDIKSADENRAAAVVAAHNGTTVAPDNSAAKAAAEAKLAALGLTADDLKALGL